MDEFPSPPPLNPLLTRGAAELARLIAAREVSSRDVVNAYVQRVEQINSRLNAMCWPLLDQARAAAARADENQARGRPLGPLHGVPVTVKECFHLAGAPSTMGLTALREKLEAADAPLVARWKQAGAIVLGKTNVPQLMILHETDNPLYGRTNNPWNEDRTPGGSSGGEASLIAACGSPLGLGTDLGGSIRIPAHFCGVAGLKPTGLRLTKRGTVENLRGMEAMHFQPGPLARRVEDLELAMRVLASDVADPREDQAPPLPWRESSNVDIARLRVGVFREDGYARTHPAVLRAVDEAAAALRTAGADVDDLQPPSAARGMALYFGLVGADGAADLKRLAHRSKLDPRVAEILRLGGAPRWLRPALARMLRWRGQSQLAEIVAAAGPRSADSYWRLIHQTRRYVRDFLSRLHAERFDAVLCPPHAQPAFRHGEGGPGRLIAASYAFVMNLLGVPCGVVPVTRVQQEEARDGEAGLPVGVQVAAPCWREDLVLATMRAIERHTD